MTRPLNTPHLTMLARLNGDRRGATYVQYLVLVGAVAVPLLAVYASIGDTMARTYVRAALSVMGLSAGDGEP